MNNKQTQRIVDMLHATRESLRDALRRIDEFDALLSSHRATIATHATRYNVDELHLMTRDELINIARFECNIDVNVSTLLRMRKHAIVTLIMNTNESDKR